MTEDNKLEFQSFFNDIQRDEKELTKKEKYQTTLKNSILHIMEVIKNHATNQQLNKYKDIDLRAKNTILEIETNITNIIDSKEMLENILNKTKENLNSNDDFSNEQIAYLLNAMVEYAKKRSLIEKNEDSIKIKNLLKELNDISDEISMEKEENIQINISVQKQDDKSSDFVEQKQAQESKEKENTNEVVKINTSKETKEESNNVLIISERNGKVYLPYSQRDIDYLLSSGKYKTKKEIIETLYTVPLSRYSNAVASRITEGFKLMREREKASLAESIKYAYNLAFERKLHPAIITACKTMDDLEVYLGLLDNQLTNLFDCFEIKFEYSPMEVNTNKREFSKGV